MMLLKESDLPKLGTDKHDVRLYEYLRELQEKLNYILTHIGDENIDFSDISRLTEKINGRGGDGHA